MTLVRCHGDHAAAAFTIAAASNAVAENAEYTQPQRFPPIRGTIGPVQQRPEITSTKPTRQKPRDSLNNLARGESRAVRPPPIFEEKLTTSIASSRHGVGSALVSRRLHHPWPSWRVSGVQRRRFFCRARAVAP